MRHYIALALLVLSAPPALAAAMQPADPFITRLAVLVLAGFIGYYVVWAVTPALHTPLMSMTNAISGVVIVGAIIAAATENRGGADNIARWIGIIAIALAAINIAGGFLVTRRMLAMYRGRKKADNNDR